VKHDKRDRKHNNGAGYERYGGESRVYEIRHHVLPNRFGTLYSLYGQDREPETGLCLLQVIARRQRNI
jgi:hypothetical protein